MDFGILAIAFNKSKITLSKGYSHSKYLLYFIFILVLKKYPNISRIRLLFTLAIFGTGGHYFKNTPLGYKAGSNKWTVLHKVCGLFIPICKIFTKMSLLQF
ncbi:hypothetical protein EZS27_032050 [termite gut metagenome]|uniref:Uncharacterized protein n=1 Tax=termite gut metagenome TaxID=433724 RepID=A0A5J4QAD4_9ZZZZ